MPEDIRFTYTDSNSNQQVIASTVTGQGLDIDRAKEERRAKNTDKISVWGNNSLYASFPQDRSNFESNEPEINVEQLVDGTWEQHNRVFAKDTGTIKKRNQCKVTLYGFFQYTGQQDIDIGPINTNIVDAMDAVITALNGDYVLDTPNSGDVPGGYPSVDDYTLKDKAKKAYKELQRNFDWSLQFTGEKDGSGNVIVRFEPEGFGGSVDTIDENTSGLQVLNWSEERTNSIVNKVEVIGTIETTNSEGETVTEQVSATATNDTMINRYGVKFERIKVGFLGSQSEAQRIAENNLTPGLDENGNDITEPPSSGKIKVPTLNFRDGVENDSFNVNITQLEVDDTFTCVQQNLYYPSGSTELSFEFEKEGLERRAEKDEYLGEERSQLLTSGSDQQSVGPISIDDDETDTELVSEQYDADTQVDHPHGNSNSTADAGFIRATPVVDEFLTQRTITAGSQEVWTFSGLNADVESDPAFITLNLSADNVNTILAIEVEITFGVGTNTYLNETFTTGFGGDLMTGIPIRTSFEGLTIDDVEITIFNYAGQNDQDVSGILQILAQGDHDHFIPIADTDGNTADLSIDVNNNDSSAGDTSQLTVSGETVEELISILQTIEEKTDR